MNTPGAERIFLFVGTKKLGELVMKKGNITMAIGTFEEFETENATAIEYLPYATGPDKEMLVAFELPFTITGVRTRVSNFPDENGEDRNEILYDLRIDTTSPTFNAMSKIKDIKSGYCLTLAENAFRAKQVKDLIQPAIDANTPMRAKLVKRGRAYAFASA